MAYEIVLFSVRNLVVCQKLKALSVAYEIVLFSVRHLGVRQKSLSPLIGLWDCSLQRTTFKSYASGFFLTEISSFNIEIRDFLVDPVVFLQRSSLFFVVVVAQVKVTKSQGRMVAKVKGILCSTVAEVKVVLWDVVKAIFVCSPVRWLLKISILDIEIWDSLFVLLLISVDIVSIREKCNV